MDLSDCRGAVVVGLTESGESWLALDRAAGLAVRRGARLVVLNVADHGTRAYANRLVRRAVAEVRRRDTAVEASGVVVTGAAAEVLTAVARTADAVLTGERDGRWAQAGTWALSRPPSRPETPTRTTDLRE